MDLIELDLSDFTEGLLLRVIDLERRSLEEGMKLVRLKDPNVVPQTEEVAKEELIRQVLETVKRIQKLRWSKNVPVELFEPPDENLSFEERHEIIFSYFEEQIDDLDRRFGPVPGLIKYKEAVPRPNFSAARPDQGNTEVGKTERGKSETDKMEQAKTEQAKTKSQELDVWV